MSVVQVFRDLLFRSLLGGFDDGDEGPGGGPPPGSPPTSAQTTGFSFPAIRVADAATLTSPSQIRRPLVHDSAGAVKHNRTFLFPGLLVLQDKMAVVIRSPDETERQGSSRHPTVSAHRPLGFSPHEAHAHQAFFGWILPTIRTSEFTILQIVGLDAAVVGGIPIPLRVELIIDSKTSAVKLLQDVVLPVLCLFHIRGGDPHAN